MISSIQNSNSTDKNQWFQVYTFFNRELLVFRTVNMSSRSGWQAGWNCDALTMDSGCSKNDGYTYPQYGSPERSDDGRLQPVVWFWIRPCRRTEYFHLTIHVVQTNLKFIHGIYQSIKFCNDRVPPLQEFKEWDLGVAIAVCCQHEEQALLLYDTSGEKYRKPDWLGYCRPPGHAPWAILGALRGREGLTADERCVGYCESGVAKLFGREIRTRQRLCMVEFELAMVIVGVAGRNDDCNRKTRSR